MTRGERASAKLLLMIAMQMSSLMRAVSQTDAPEDCATGIYYTAVPDSMFPICDPFDHPLSMLCRVKIHSNQTNMMDMNWFFAEGGVPVSSAEQCPLLEGDTGMELLNSSTRHTVVKHWDPAEQTLSVTLTINPLQEQDIGRYWCQATLPGVALSRTSAYCQRDASQTSFIPFPCETLFRESNVCVAQIPQTTPTVLISSIPALSSIVAPILNSPSIVASVLATTHSSSLSPSATSISDFSRPSYFESFAIVSSTQTQVTSLHIVMSSSSSHYSQSPTSTTINKPVSGENSSNDVLVMSIVFCTLSAIILLATVIIALSVIKCHQRMRRWVPELHVSEGLETGHQSMTSQSPQPIIPKTMDSASSDGHTRFQIHQIPQNPLHSTLQNMSINLGPSSMSVSSDIYSEIGPPLQDSSLNHHEMLRTSPPVPPRPVTSRQENLYDVPETDDTRSVTPHTYTLPADAREGATIGSTSRNTTIEHYTSSTGDSWFGRCSPVLVIQQRYSPQADILDGIPVGINHGSDMSLQTQASSEIHETDTENDDESGVSLESITHEPLEAYLPRDHSWVMVHLPLAQVQPTTSVSLQLPLGFLRSSFAEDMRDTAELRPGCASESPPSSFTQPSRLLVSNTGNSSPSPSTSSGCTDLSKYSGDYERDPLYMERMLQQRAAMVATNNELLSSAESAIYSPLSPVSPQPPQTSGEFEHRYTPLNCYRLEPTPAYSRLQRYQVIETTV